MSVAKKNGGSGSPRNELLAEIESLKARLAESEETLSAIRDGEVDALIVGEKLYVLEGVKSASNRFRGEVMAQMDDAVIATDIENRITYLNAAAERQYGMPASAALGNPLQVLYQLQWMDESDEKRARQSLENNGSWRGRSIHIKSHGEEIVVESTVTVTHDGEGKQSGLLAVIRDVTDSIVAERQLAAIVENSPDVFTRFDRNRRFIYVSPVVRQYTGRNPDEYIGKTNAELMAASPELAEVWDRAIDAAMETKKIQRVEFAFDGPDQVQRHFETRLIPELAPNGIVESILSIATDVTERRLADELLRDADRRKDEFLATLAHELRNPLAPIRNALQIMELTPDVAVHQNARGIIGRQLKQMVHLVDDLLDVSRISQGKVELRRQRIDIINAVQTAIETSRPAIDAGKHQLSVRLPPPKSMIVDADLTRLAQIIANLLHNAAKYTREGGCIEIDVEREDRYARISVKDSGVGIPTEMLPRVFDMFAQVDRSLERSQGGLGIGLALVKRLVAMHGGSVHAHSEGLDRGSKFVVTIPLAEGAESAQAHAHEVHAGPTNGVRVLVVDDNFDSAESLSHVLQVMGYQTRVAHDGIEAINAANDYRPRVVLLDLGLPKMNGLEVASTLRDCEWGKEVLLIALSGWGQEEDRRKTAKAGFDFHFVKPVDIEALTDLMTANAGHA